MKKKIKIWLHTGSTSSIREFTIPKSQLACLSFLLFSILAVLAFVGYDYAKLKKASFEKDLLCRQIESQNSEINLQRSQLQTLACDINQLKGNFAALSNFEKKVRVIANLKKKGDDNGGFFGIGGVSGEDIDPEIPLTERHNSLIREMHQQADQINLSAQRQKVNLEELLTSLNKKRNLLAATPSIRPARGWITSTFGYRSSPFTGKKQFHSGLDIANKKGKKIVATANGVVAYSGEKMFIGKMVMIDHGHGIVTKFGHMDKIFVKKGERVNRGDVIGLMGNTGRSTGPHVHYEVRINGTPVNPEKYIVD